jgi:hypothetical protein
MGGTTRMEGLGALVHPGGVAFRVWEAVARRFYVGTSTNNATRAETL